MNINSKHIVFAFKYILILFFLFIINISYAEKIDTNYINALFLKAENYSKLSNQQNDSKIISLYIDAIHISDSLNFKSKKAESYQRLGNYYRNKADYQNALENLFLALSNVNENNWLMSSILNNIGVVYRRLDDYNTALDFHLKALKIAESISDKKNISVSWNSIGNINTFLANYPEALFNFRRALELETSTQNKLGEAINCNNIGEVHAMIGNIDSATYYFERSLNLNVELKNDKGIAINYNSLGAIFKNLGNYKESLKYFQKALELDRLSNDRIYVLRTLNNIGEVYLETNMANKALNYFFESLKIALELGAKFEIHRTYKLISDAYRKIGALDKALNYIDTSKVYADSVFNEKNANSINHLQILYNIEKKDKQIQLLGREKENESNVKLFLGLISIVILGFAFIYYRRFKIQVLLSKTLKEKNSIIESKNNELMMMNERIKEQNQKLEELNISLTEKNYLITKAQENLLLLNNNLKEANSTKDKFFSIISHDLKNPFNYLLVTTELLKQNYHNYSDEQITSQIDNLFDSSQQVYNLLENLLGWANSQRGTFHFIPTDVDFYEIALNNVMLFKPNAEKKNISLNFNISPNTYIYADYNLINTVVRNLISNAIKFTNSYGKVELFCKTKIDMLEIIIKDNGIGISEDRIQMLFRIDQNVSTIGTANENGTGLGLVLVKEFIEKMGGQLSIKSKPGYGTEFSFTVPLSELNENTNSENNSIYSNDSSIINILEVNENYTFVTQSTFDYINIDLKNQRDYVLKVRQLGLIKDFANQLLNFASDNQIFTLEKYGNNLKNCVETFDFEKIEESLLNFDLIIKNIKVNS